VIRDLVTAMALCHTVIPVKNARGEVKLLGKSEEEVCMIRYIESLGYILNKRDERTITLTNKADEVEEYEILE